MCYIFMKLVYSERNQHLFACHIIKWHPEIKCKISAQMQYTRSDCYKLIIHRELFQNSFDQNCIPEGPKKYWICLVNRMMNYKLWWNWTIPVQQSLLLRMNYYHMQDTIYSSHQWLILLTLLFHLLSTEDTFPYCYYFHILPTSFNIENVDWRVAADIALPVGANLIFIENSIHSFKVMVHCVKRIHWSSWCINATW